MARQPRQGLATFPDGDGENSGVRLFREVLALALRDDDAEAWLCSNDGQLVCWLADVDREAVLLAFRRGLTAKRKPQSPFKGGKFRSVCLRGNSAALGLCSDDGRLVTDLADVDRDWVLRVIGGRTLT